MAYPWWMFVGSQKFAAVIVTHAYIYRPSGQWWWCNPLHWHCFAIESSNRLPGQLLAVTVHTIAHTDRHTMRLYRHSCLWQTTSHSQVGRLSKILQIRLGYICRQIAQGGGGDLRFFAVFRKRKHTALVHTAARPWLDWLKVGGSFSCSGRESEQAKWRLYMWASFREGPKSLLSADYFSSVWRYYGPITRKHTHPTHIYHQLTAVLIECMYKGYSAIPIELIVIRPFLQGAITLVSKLLLCLKSKYLLKKCYEEARCCNSGDLKLIFNLIVETKCGNSMKCVFVCFFPFQSSLCLALFTEKINFARQITGS